MLCTEIEIRRLFKVFIQKFSNRLLFSELNIKNFHIIPNQFSWILLNNENLVLKDGIRPKISDLLGIISIGTKNNKFIDVTRDLKSVKNDYSVHSLQFLADFSTSDSFFTFVENKLIDSIFQLKKRFCKLLPIVFPIENLYGCLVSLSEILSILFWKFTQKSKIHRILFIETKKLLFLINKKKKFTLSNKKAKNFFLHILRRKKY